MAIASLVLGILGVLFSWTFFLGLLSILGLIFGMVGKSQIDQAGGTQQGRGLAIAGIVLGWVGIGFLLLYVLFFGSLLGCSALLAGSE